MPKITLTADEEIQYLRELDRIQEIIPDLEIQIVSEPLPYQGRYVLSDTSMGDEFRTFLLSNKLKQSAISEQAAR
jgi:hypothetical protein